MNKLDALQQQIAAINDRQPQAYLLLPAKPGQEVRRVFAYPTRHTITIQRDTAHGAKVAREETIHYRDVFIPGIHEGNRTVRADRLRLVK